MTDQAWSVWTTPSSCGALDKRPAVPLGAACNKPTLAMANRKPNSFTDTSAHKRRCMIDTSTPRRNGKYKVIMTISGIDHAAMPVSDMDAMLGFYRNLGFIVEDSLAPRLYAVTCGRNKINLHAPELWQAPSFSLRGPAAAPGGGGVRASTIPLRRLPGRRERGVASRCAGRAPRLTLVFEDESRR